MKNQITIQSYAKINLSIDVGARREDGFHPVDMMMQQVTLHDEVTIRISDESMEGASALSGGQSNGPVITISCNKPYVPTDGRNIAWKAAALMAESFPEALQRNGRYIHIEIEKRIPVAAGLAGGSGNAAAVLHGLNTMWRLGLSLSQLNELGAKLGSDVPFCVAGQARRNFVLPKKVRKDALSASAMRATGTGTELRTVRPWKGFAVIAKPALGVSTKAVYQGIDDCEIPERPDNDILERALAEGDLAAAKAQMINVLENYTLHEVPEVQQLKDLMIDNRGEEDAVVLMSGSGPSVFALLREKESARKLSSLLRKRGYESYWCNTTI